jgi:hypothetical protein
MRFRFVIALCSLAAAGCGDRTAPTEVPAAAVAPERVSAPAVSTLPPDATVAEVPDTDPAATPAPDSSEAVSEPAASPAPEVAAIAPANSAAAPTNPAPPAAKSPAPAPEAVAAAYTSPPERPAAVAAPSSLPAPVASEQPADTLDFTSLGARLRTTKSIGVLTKLSVKNQADDLLAQFREYHQRHGEATLPDLRHSYDMLVLKLLSLVQDGDPPLAVDIDRSRTAIWEILSDQRKFIDANLMAGASL